MIVEKRLDSVTDLAHGRHWLAAHPAIDGERIGIMGQSYGGFMVMSAITEYPELWRAAVNYYGIADFVTLLAGTGAWRSSHRAAEYGDPTQRCRTVRAHLADPSRRSHPRAGADRARDRVIRACRSARASSSSRPLQERQKPVTYLTFDYAGHGFIRPDDRCRIYRRRRVLHHAPVMLYRHPQSLPLPCGSAWRDGFAPNSCLVA